MSDLPGAPGRAYRLVAALLLVLLLPAAAFAQLPVVTITGVVDHFITFTKNQSIVDVNYTRSKDTEWFAHSRIRPDIVAALGSTRFVLGVEIDFTWGQVAEQGSNVLLNTGATAAAPQRPTTSAGTPLNTDVPGIIEIKWAYTEFDVPLLPWPTRLRLGAQPFVDTFKLGVLASGDFAGANATTTLTPDAKLSITYAAIEEASTGPRDNFLRGEDFAWLGSLTLTPWRGLDLRPIYAFVSAHGVTSAVARQPRGGLGATAATYPTTPSAAYEGRHTAGLDARWRLGPISIEPTLLYQWGSREIVVPAGVAGIPDGGTLRVQDRSAWLVDVRASGYVGALLIDGAAIYTTGNKARQDVRDARRTVRYYEPIDTDANFYYGMSEIFGLGTDFANALYFSANGLNTSSAIGYDKYGLMRFGVRASYAPVPNLVLRTAVHQSWTAEDVDTRGTLAAATGITPSASGAPGQHRDMGTELDVGAQYRFAPHVVLDVGGGWLFSGPALATATATSVNGITRSNRRPHDVQTIVTRVRYFF